MGEFLICLGGSALGPTGFAAVLGVGGEKPGRESYRGQFLSCWYGHLRGGGNTESHRC